MEFDRRTIWTFASPKEQICLLTLLKVQVVVAGALETKVIHNVTDLFPVDLSLLLYVWKVSSYVFNQVTHSSGYSSRYENKRTLTIFPLLRMWLRVFERPEFLL